MTASLDLPVLSRRRRSTSPEPTGSAVWADAWRADVQAALVPVPRTPTAAVLAPPARRGWRDRLWQLFGVLAVVLPMLGLVLSATTGEELWLLPAAAVAALVAVALTVWT